MFKNHLVHSSLMITTVKNIRGYQICVLNVLFSSLCVAGMIWCIFKSVGWFTSGGLIIGIASVIHKSILLSRRRAYIRLNQIHAIIALIYVLAILTSMIAPSIFTKANQKDSYFYLAEGFILVPLISFFVALHYRNNQLIQNYLHPYTEIIDGFSKSSGSIQMTDIPTASTSSLKQVVVMEGDKKENNEEDSKDDNENSLLPANKADGNSPKPSKVLKMWPKADPFPVRALYHFKTDSTNELPFRKGDILSVLDCRGKWWQAQKDERVGFIPSNYVAVILKGRVKSSFTAIEDDQVSLIKDQIVEVMEHYEEKCLVRNVEGKIGAVPTEQLDFIKADE